MAHNKRFIHRRASVGSSTFRNALTKLRGPGLITTTSDVVRLSEGIFP